MDTPVHFTQTYTVRIDSALDATHEQRIRHFFREAFTHTAGVQRISIDHGTRMLTIESTDPIAVENLISQAASQDIRLQLVPGNETVMNVCIDGMTCHSCELTIERKWKKLPGVQRVDVSANSGKAKIVLDGHAPSLAELQDALGESEYVVSKNGSVTRTDRPSLLQLVGLFALVLLLGKLFSSFGLLKTNFTIGSGMSFGAIVVIGLVAASSSCIAVVGGLLLSSAAKFNERYRSAGPVARMRPVFLFLVGRISGYTFFGGLLGVIGKALTPSPLVTAIIMILAALYMFVMGLDMLHIAPAWLKALTPKMPKFISRRVVNAEEKEHPLAPILLGAATFFLPCGFTQALQLYALSTGSFVTGALALLAFAIGTAPALFALGWASSSLKGKAGRFFFKFSGALVVVLGLWNIQNGLTIAGVTLPTISITKADSVQAVANDPNVTFDGKTQILKMSADAGGYHPDRFTIKAGLPTRWEIDGTNAAGCENVLVSRPLGIQRPLAAGQNVIEFTAPTQPGTYPFSCSMGMYRGQITVI